ncbi:hypothetical protein [Kitasatospora sp. NBC_01302]|uniref:hypothetical protein n=1 Tax=Kitasatospora sp. NBC_01302 TaxID=2903575 RepID=UPI002E111C86|nr:hypothetical protein OG294_13715 [Kitasatospora sp. NBC_01302]
MSQLTDHRPTVTVGTLYDLNEQYLASRTHRGLSVGSRSEVREDGQRFGLGGLDWMLVTPTAVYKVVTAEDEVLPDLPVVRDGWPYGLTSGTSEVAA